MTEQFKDIFEDMPDWQDCGRMVEAIRADGSKVVAEVEAIDMTPGPDESPILGFVVGGKELSWFDFEKWRYTETITETRTRHRMD
jgi:hypothetical protein